MPNADAIDRTIALMREHRDAFDMRVYVGLGSRFNQEVLPQLHSCGTTLCIAGFAVVANQEGVFPGQIGRGPAAEILGISDPDANELFVPDMDLIHDETGDLIEPLHETDVERGIAVLEHLKNTGDVDWLVAYPGYSVSRSDSE